MIFQGFNIVGNISLSKFDTFSAATELTSCIMCPKNAFHLAAVKIRSIPKVRRVVKGHCDTTEKVSVSVSRFSFVEML